MTRTIRRATAIVVIVAAMFSAAPAGAASGRVGHVESESIVDRQPATAGHCKIADVSFWLVSVCV